jgi:hypothetical protein
MFLHLMSFGGGLAIVRAGQNTNLRWWNTWIVILLEP